MFFYDFLLSGYFSHKKNSSQMSKLNVTKAHYLKVL